MSHSSVITALEAAAKVATEERLAAQERERQALFATEDAKAAASHAASRRAELANIVAAAQAVEDGCRDRLGEVRLQYGAAMRELERLADLAAAGSDPATRAVAKARDNVETLAALTAAHERRTVVAVADRERAEAELQTHDDAEAARLRAQIEQMMVTSAERIDALYSASCPELLALVAMIESYRTDHRPSSSEVTDWQMFTPNVQAQRALLPALARAEPAYARVGPSHAATHTATMGKLIRDLMETWRRGRGEFEPQPLEAA